MYLIVTNDYEQRANDYENLEDQLADMIASYKSDVGWLESAVSAYKSVVPTDLQLAKIPAVEFEPKRETYTTKLNGAVTHESGYESTLTAAKTTAGAQKDKYIALAEAYKAKHDGL